MAQADRKHVGLRLDCAKLMGQHQKFPPQKGDLTTRSYQLYYGSGHYDRRYPSPNVTTWRRILALVPPEGHVIDFGCGSGRYLLRLKEHVRQGAGFDINPAALDLLHKGAAELDWTDLVVLGPESAALDVHVRLNGAADVVLCLFGVLAHIEARTDRIAALRQMHASLKHQSGKLLISVPNKSRRFFREQRKAGADAKGLIRYTRVMEGTEVTLPYQLFDAQRLTTELEASGFEVQSIRAESVLPESYLSNYAICRWIDSVLTRFCPARWGYGLIAVATR